MHDAIDQWNDQLGAVRFAGVDVPDSGSLLPAPPLNPNVLLVLGDSITQTGLTLYTGVATDQLIQAPHLGFAKLLADYLCFDFVQIGYGGTGIATAGAGNIPATPATSGFCYAGVPYVPANPPILVVLNIGTNDRGGWLDGLPDGIYAGLLAQIKAAYADPYVIAINPFGQLRDLATSRRRRLIFRIVPLLMRSPLDCIRQ